MSYVLYNTCYVPRSKQELINFLLSRINCNMSELRSKTKKQLYAMYFKVRGRE